MIIPIIICFGQEGVLPEKKKTQEECNLSLVNGFTLGFKERHCKAMEAAKGVL